MLANGVQLIEFYEGSVEIRDSEGNPKQDPRKFIRITHPGGKTVTEREVRPEDKVVYMAQYKAFEDGIEFEGDGTRLRDISFLSKAELETCLKAKVYTVEQLASVDDIGMKALGLNGRMLAQKAKDWLAGSKNIDSVINKINALEQQIISQQDIISTINGLKAENLKKDSTIAQLQNKLDELMSKKGKK